MKKPVVIGSIALIGCVLIAGAFVVRTRWMIAKNTSKELPAATVAPKEQVLWEDPAGFSLKYPSDLTVNKHDEDTENYAHLEFSSSKHGGTIIVWAKDTSYQSVNAWIKSDTLVSGGTSVDTTLGGKEAKKIIVSGPPKKLITGVIDEEILFTIEVDPQTDETYWEEVYQEMIRTFSFVPLKESTTEASQDVEEADSFDEEEVLE